MCRCNKQETQYRPRRRLKSEEEKKQRRTNANKVFRIFFSFSYKSHLFRFQCVWSLFVCYVTGSISFTALRSVTNHNRNISRTDTNLRCINAHTCIFSRIYQITWYGWWIENRESTEIILCFSIYFFLFSIFVCCMWIDDLLFCFQWYCVSSCSCSYLFLYATSFSVFYTHKNLF